jgi:hypothetical protein
VKVNYGPTPTPQQLQAMRDRADRLLRVYESIRANPRPTNAQQMAAAQSEMILRQSIRVSAGWMWRLSVPAWLVFALTLLLPAIWLRRFLILLRRRRAGLCRQCGYDLRGHEPGSRCPECGTMAATFTEGIA